MNRTVLVSFLLFSNLAFAAPPAPATPAKGKKMFAVLETSMGNFKVQLFADKAPKTVENFVGLAKGTKEWTDPKTGKKQKKPLCRRKNLRSFHFQRQMKVKQALAILKSLPKQTGL